MAAKDDYSFVNQAAMPTLIFDLFANFIRSWDYPNSNHDYLIFFAQDAHLVFSPSISTKTGMEFGLSERA